MFGIVADAACETRHVGVRVHILVYTPAVHILLGDASEVEEEIFVPVAPPELAGSHCGEAAFYLAVDKLPYCFVFDCNEPAAIDMAGIEFFSCVN